MPQRDVHQCQCSTCTGPDRHPDREIHSWINLLMSRLDEQQRRWYAAVASTNGTSFGFSAHWDHGWDSAASARRGLSSLDANLDDSPPVA